MLEEQPLERTLLKLQLVCSISPVCTIMEATTKKCLNISSPLNVRFPIPRCFSRDQYSEPLTQGPPNLHEIASYGLGERKSLLSLVSHGIAKSKPLWFPRHRPSNMPPETLKKESLPAAILRNEGASRQEPGKAPTSRGGSPEILTSVIQVVLTVIDEIWNGIGDGHE